MARDRDRSKAQRNLPCMACSAAETAKKHGGRADTICLFGLANAEVHDVKKVFEGLCPTHRNTYRLIRDAIDNEAEQDKTEIEALNLAIANAAAAGRH